MSERVMYKEFDQCPICGETLRKTKNNKNISCNCCGFVAPTEEITSLDEARLLQASDALRSYKFNDADELYSLIIDDNRDNFLLCASCLWGKVLASFGINYIRDINNTLIPTFSEYDKDVKGIIENEYYQELLDLDISDEILNSYKAKAQELNDIYQKIDSEVNSSFEYDLFICTKISQKTPKNPNKKGYTEDSKIADEFYYNLKEAGLNVFYSDKCCQGIEYDSQILTALLKSKRILVIATEKDYLESPWVESEWRRWLNFIDAGVKSKDSMILYLPYFEKDRFDLNRALRKVQRFTSQIPIQNILLNDPSVSKKEVIPVINNLGKNAEIENPDIKKINDILEIENKFIKKIISQEENIISLGYFPQSQKTKNVNVTQVKVGPYFKGTDGRLYHKENDKYYMVEPINFRVVYRGEGEIFLVSEKILYTNKTGFMKHNNDMFKYMFFDEKIDQSLIEYVSIDRSILKEQLTKKDYKKKATDFVRDSGAKNEWAINEKTTKELEYFNIREYTTVVSSLGLLKKVCTRSTLAKEAHISPCIGMVLALRIKDLKLHSLLTDEDQDKIYEVKAKSTWKNLAVTSRIGEHVTNGQVIGSFVFSYENSSRNGTWFYSECDGIIFDKKVTYSNEVIDEGTVVAKIYKK